MNISARDLTIWIIVPFVLILCPFIRKFLFHTKTWFLEMSISFSLIIIIYILSYILLKRRRFFDKFLTLMPIFQLGLLIIFLGGLVDIPWIAGIRNEAELQTKILITQALLQGLCGVYLFLLGNRLKNFFLKNLPREYIDRLQYIIPMIPMFPILLTLINIINMGKSSVLADALNFTPLILLSSGFLLGLISIASGIVWGCEPNVLLLLGGLFNFCINFIVEVIIIFLAQITMYLPLVIMSFILNSSLLTGLVCYLGSDRDVFLFTFIQSVINFCKNP